MAITELGLTVSGAAGFLGVNRNTAQNWALGKTRIPNHVAILLFIMVDKRLNPYKLSMKINEQKRSHQFPHD